MPADWVLQVRLATDIYFDFFFLVGASTPAVSMGTCALY